MYSLDQLYRGVRNPRLIGRELNRRYYTHIAQESPEAVNFLDEDWDNLIILDACRYDLFSQMADLPGDLEYRYSLGSATYEFVRKNFQNRVQHDVVYVGANTWLLKLRDEIDAEIHHFVDLQNGDYDVTWADEKLNVVTPETVTHHAIRTEDEYPNKRLIIHYLQPHHPFIGPTGKQHFTHQSSSLMDVIRESDGMNRENLYEAYRENLEFVLDEVNDLIPELTGKTVVTADHGEMLGDRHEIVPTRDYGHPYGIYNETLTKVPWHVVDTGERKEVIEEEPDQRLEVDMDALNDQLRNLGYVP